MLLGQYVLLTLVVLFFVLTLRGRSLVDRAYRVHIVGWIVVWVLGGLVVVFPAVLSRVAEILGIGRGVDVVVYIGMMVLVYVVFRLMIRIYLMEREITKLVRHIALRGDADHERDS